MKRKTKQEEKAGRLVKIWFENAQDTVSVTYKLKILLRHAIVQTLLYEQYDKPCEVSLTFTDNRGIQKMNQKFRGIDRATDVLSFPLFDYDGETDEPPLYQPTANLGDIVISLERAKEQADEYGHSFSREAAFLCVHSVLHLLGYDHEKSPEEEADMRRRQSEIMERLGLGIRQVAKQEEET